MATRPGLSSSPVPALSVSYLTPFLVVFVSPWAVASAGVYAAALPLSPGALGVRTAASPWACAGSLLSGAVRGRTVPGGDVGTISSGASHPPRINANPRHPRVTSCHELISFSPHFDKRKARRMMKDQAGRVAAPVSHVADLPSLPRRHPIMS